jgi:hypothetical protein
MSALRTMNLPNGRTSLDQQSVMLYGGLKIDD